MHAISRERLLGQKGGTLWLTGYSGSGKTTLAYALEVRLLELGHVAIVLDGDIIRSGLCSDLGYSLEERSENVRRTAEVAKLLSDAGLFVIVALISPLHQHRAFARTIIGNTRFIEVFVDTPLEVCKARDPKGLYARASRGEIQLFTGISSPYDVPRNPDVSIATQTMSTKDAADLLSLRMIQKFCEDSARS